MKKITIPSILCLLNLVSAQNQDYNLNGTITETTNFEKFDESPDPPYFYDSNNIDSEYFLDSGNNVVEDIPVHTVETYELENEKSIAYDAIVSSVDPLPMNATVTGELRRYHKITLTWSGPNRNESSATYRNHRLNVTFTSPSGKAYVVPGYFAADGNAGESGSVQGDKWRCHFTPVETGRWSYTVSFRTGLNIAARLNAAAGIAASFNGDSGSFAISETNKRGNDFRAKGKLEYVGEHFLQWSNGDYFLKFGSNSPETFLEYQDFDGTPSTNTYAAHVSDWNTGDPLWRNNRGRGLIGAVNYMSEQGVNAQYFLTMNQYGDGQDAYPWTGLDRFYTYDVSKLDQWQIVFDHMMEKGVMPHIVTTEQENQSYFEFNEGGTFANSRKIYYRELVARFGYLNAVTWNIGEESGWNRGSNGRNNPVTTAQRIAFADYVSQLTPYNDNISVHNGPSSEPVARQIYNGLIGDGNEYTSIAYQGQYQVSSSGHDDVLHWINRSRASGKRWVVSYDEPFLGFNPTATHLDDWRKNSLWASLTAGAAGIEFFTGGGVDLNLQNYNSYAIYWRAMRIASQFFTNNDIPFHEMSNADALVDNGVWCLTNRTDTYVVYLPSGGTSTIDLAGDGSYDVQWYNPRNGGALQNGSLATVNSGTNVRLGNPPNSRTSDWVVVLVKNEEIGTIENEEPTPAPSGAQTMTLSPIQDAYLEGSTRFNSNIIRVEAGNRTGYLLYDLNGVNGTITNAQLQITIASDAGSGTINVNKGSTTTWRETNLSTINRPSSGALLGSVNTTYAVGGTHTVDLNVSELEADLTSFIISQANGNDIDFASKEHPSLPAAELLITYVPNPVPTETVTLSPIQDAYLQGSLRQNINIVRLEQGNRTGYLQYDLSNINGTVTAAELQFTISSDAGNGNINVNKGNTTNWTETNLSITNRPGLGAFLGSINRTYVIGARQSVILDASEINGNALSLVLTKTSGAGVGADTDFASKENTTIPSAQLVLTYRPSQGARLQSDLDNENEGTFSSSSKMLVFPNPTTNSINITGMEGQKKIVLMDLTGRVIYETTSSESEPIMHMEEYSNGIYVMKVEGEETTETFKIVKE